MTAISRRVAIAVNRSRNLAVGMPATVRRKAFPRWPRPMVSRPVTRASAKLSGQQLQPLLAAGPGGWV